MPQRMFPWVTDEQKQPLTNGQRLFACCKKKNVSFGVSNIFLTALLVAEPVLNAQMGKIWIPGQNVFYIHSHSSVARQYNG